MLASQLFLQDLCNHITSFNTYCKDEECSLATFEVPELFVPALHS